jgi:hypothetical protein
MGLEQISILAPSLGRGPSAPLPRGRQRRRLIWRAYVHAGPGPISIGWMERSNGGHVAGNRGREAGASALDLEGRSALQAEKSASGR